VPLLTITPAKAQLLPAAVKIDLFFIFDGDGRLYTKTFTRRLTRLDSHKFF
jgi:hypothetical protein